MAFRIILGREHEFEKHTLVALPNNGLKLTKTSLRSAFAT